MNKSEPNSLVSKDLFGIDALLKPHDLKEEKPSGFFGFLQLSVLNHPVLSGLALSIFLGLLQLPLLFLPVPFRLPMNEMILWPVFLLETAFVMLLVKLLSMTFLRSHAAKDSHIVAGLARTAEIQKVSIMGFAKISEARDQSTGNHITRMGKYAKVIAEEMGKSDNFKDYITMRYTEDIFIAAPLHDMGKVGIADNILKKAGGLTMSEFEIMKMHTIIGGDLMAELERKLPFKTFYTLGKEIAYHHHQKWNGTGYPNVLQVGDSTALFVQDGVGSPLSGKEIPLSARIVAVADVYDALVSKRIYKEAFTHEVAKRMIVEESGQHFDPEVVDAFLNAEERIIATVAKFKD